MKFMHNPSSCLTLSRQQAVDDNSSNCIPDIPDRIPQMDSVDDSSAGNVSEQELDVGTTSEVFSQLMDPKG
ncbi:hypothetical protein ACLOJK_023315 [Asimina triloba]